MSVVVAIDGTAGSGKSTVARAVGAALGLPVLDTGAMYRAVTLRVVRAGIDPQDAAACASAARQARLAVEDGRVSLDGEDVTGAIRGPEVTAAVSTVSAHPQVRAELVARQRDWVARHGGGVVEGRDIGTVVFPDATLKVFLTASPEERARRRAAQEPDAVGRDVDAVREALAARDARDAGREHSPLRPAADALVVDTTGRSVAEVVGLVLERLGAGAGEPRETG